MQIAPGCTVEIAYVLTLANGEIVERTEAEKPLRFLCGAGEILPALERAILDLSADQELDFQLEPELAYGPRDPEAVLSVPRGEIPPDITLEEGLVYLLHGEDREDRVVTIAEVGESDVLLDFNHPLAGETLHFHVKVLSVAEAEVAPTPN